MQSISEFEPDIFDLDSYILENHPNIHSATKYLSDASASYRIQLMQWKADGKPDIETFAQ